MPDISTANGVPSSVDIEEHRSRVALLRRARAGDPAAIHLLADRYHVRLVPAVPLLRDATVQNSVQRGETMGNELARCEVCGKHVKAQGLGVHKHRSHGISRSEHPAMGADARPATAETEEAEPDGPCGDCVFRGLDRQIDRELVRRAILGGMGLDAAIVFVRDAKLALTSIR